MGRARSSMEPLEDKKERNISFKRRIVVIRTKALELSTLCAIPISMVLYGPQGNLETWASGIDDNHPPIIEHMFTKFKTQPPDERRKTRVSIPDYFMDRKKKLESQLAKLRRENNEPKYPDWHPKFDTFQVTELAILWLTLRNRLEYAKNMRDFVKVEDLAQNQNLENQIDQWQHHNEHLFGGEDYSKALAMVEPQSLDEMMVMNNYYNDNNQPLAMMKPTTTNPGDAMMPLSNYSSFQEFDHEQYNQLLARIRPSNMEGNDYYNMQQFGGDQYNNYCYNYPGQQLNYDNMDSLPNTGASDSGQFFDNLTDLNNTSLSQLLYEGTYMSSAMNLMSQLQMFQYYGVQGDNC